MSEVATCNLCGSPEFSVLFKAGIAQVHQIVKCSKCELMYAFPVPDRNYDIYADQKTDLPPLEPDDPTILRGFDKLPDYQTIPAELKKHISFKGRVLEVGCYVGVFLQSLKQEGWDVTGVELDTRAVEFARKHFDLTILNKPLESLDTASSHDNFDVVTMLHLIEHLDDPASTLAVAFRVLTPGGILVIETPTYDSLLFKLLGRRERSLSCNGHIFFYTVATLSRLLEKTGFEVLESRKVGRTVSLGRLLWNIGVMSKSRAVQHWLQSLVERLNLLRSGPRIRLNARDMVRIYCRKP
jgi:2-polyprenyl-3-methyl-5-hydroxy-6-metoxy-1,4-benzoquinol methylase